MKIGVIGCGPAGLLSAHAATQNGHEVVIFSKRPEKSHLNGSQYLHEPIPGIYCGPRATVTYELTGGDLAGYRQKVYGSKWDGDVSPGTLDGEHSAWDIRVAYDNLWTLYHKQVFTLDLDQRGAGNLRLMNSVGERLDLDAIISSIPRTAWDEDDGNFRSSSVWAYGDAPGLGQVCPIRPPADNMVICDADQDTGWYRLSSVFGHATCEWPEGRKPPIPGVAKVSKPLNHRSTAAKEFTHVGRYGEWRKGVLSTDAYRKALECTA